MPGRTVHYTAAGYRPQLVDIAPDAEDIQSKRYDMIEAEDKNLVVNLGTLEEGTRARNREILRRLNEVWSQTSGWEAKMLTEEKEAEESIKQIRSDYEMYFQEFEDSFLADVRETFRRIDENMIPPHVERVRTQAADVEHYVHVTVPEAIENQSGVVSRELKKQYETFDIEKQKGKKKEMKFIMKVNEHIQTTAQKFVDEDALLASCFFNLEEDIVYSERRAARMHLRRYDNAVKDVMALDEEIAAVVEKRKIEDVDILDTIIETQQLLQKTILDHFGSEDQAKGFGEKPNFKKLESRINSRGSSRAGTAASKGSAPGADSSSHGGKSEVSRRSKK